MTTIYLENITINFPASNFEYNQGLADHLEVLGRKKDDVLALTGSDQDFYPKLSVDFRSDCQDVSALFELSNGETISIKVENTTGLSKQNPFSYSPISLAALNQRFTTLEARILGIDHLGFNLPWFKSDLHPRIVQLRKELSSMCLYHKFPTGEPWDFIIPGDLEEIAKRKPVNYSKNRKPKFELVSFHNSSTPLIQFDLGINSSYESFLPLFPEAINDPELKNIWVYLENPYPIDICLVIHEFSLVGDWSTFFESYRL